MSYKKRNIAFTWGGSGGHILPILSLMEYIDTHDECHQFVKSVYRFGEKKGMEYDFFQSSKNTFAHIHPKFVPILAGKYRRETIWISRWRNFRDIFLFPLGIIQSMYRLFVYHIDIVFCKWGYVSLPVVIAGWILRKKIFVHDSDTTPGLTTRLASRFATKNFTGFPDTLPNSIYVGQILSSDLISKFKIQNSKFKINNKINILIAWWSLGAKKLYLGVLEAIKKLWKKSDQYHFTFINGKDLLSSSDLPKMHDNITITWLIKSQQEMGKLYATADMAIVRGWTTTLAECKLFDLPLVIVPLPITHDQAKNAARYVTEYQDTMISQNSPTFVQELQQSLLSAIIKNKIYNYERIDALIKWAKEIILYEMLDK
jgi:UDP-N-acetylglucosamine--N-acetylmuramyl-(pentapeptide) pyrophosphoryl-undecaprenol N-acetylglucosamine transferase